MIIILLLLSHLPRQNYWENSRGFSCKIKHGSYPRIRQNEISIIENFTPVILFLLKKKVVSELKELVKNQKLYGWHLMKTVRVKLLHGTCWSAETHSWKLQRIVFHEITKDAIKEAIKIRGIDKIWSTPSKPDVWPPGWVWIVPYFMEKN